MTHSRHPWLSHPAFQRGRNGRTDDFADEPKNATQPAEQDTEQNSAGHDNFLMAWRGLLYNSFWATLGENKKHLWRLAGESHLFVNHNRADRALRIALSKNMLDEDLARSHAPGWVALAPPHYTVSHPLRRAVMAEDPLLLRALLDAHANLAIMEEKSRQTPIHHAALRGWNEGLRIMAEKNGDFQCIDKDGRTPLHHAARQGRCGTIRELVALGADIHAACFMGRSVLGEALRASTFALKEVSTKGMLSHRRQAVVKTLLECGADLNRHDGKTKKAFTPKTIILSFTDGAKFLSAFHDEALRKIIPESPDGSEKRSRL